MTTETTCKVLCVDISSTQTQQDESGISISYRFDDNTANATGGDLESLLEMDVDIYTEQEEHLGFDPCLSLETLALQSPHGSNTIEKTWNEEGENNDVDETSADPTTESCSSKQDRRRLSLRKELFQHRIKAQDLSSPGPKTENDIDSMTARHHSCEQPEYDMASPLALPPSPTSFHDPEDAAADASCLSNQDDARLDVAVSRASPASTRLRGRKVKHGGIYSLLLKGLKRPDDNDSAVLVDVPRDSVAKTSSFVAGATDSVGELASPGTDPPTPSKRMSPSPSKMQVRHGGIYRMLREKT